MNDVFMRSAEVLAKCVAFVWFVQGTIENSHEQLAWGFLLKKQKSKTHEV